MSLKKMVLINRNICDNAQECSGIEVCATGAMFWNDKKQEIDIDPAYCAECGECVGACPIGAIILAKDDEDLKVKEAELAAETRKLEDLQVERYGASPIEKNIDNPNVDQFIEEAKEDYVLLEYFNDNSIACLLHSIRVEEIKELFEGDVKYTKVFLSEGDTTNYCLTDNLPALVIFKNKKLQGVVEGYFEDSQKEEFFSKINRLK